MKFYQPKLMVWFSGCTHDYGVFHNGEVRKRKKGGYKDQALEGWERCEYMYSDMIEDGWPNDVVQHIEKFRHALALSDWPEVPLDSPERMPAEVI